MLDSRFRGNDIVYMIPKGFILIELLVAVILFALAGSMLSFSLIQGLKTNQRIHEGFKSYDPLRLTFLQLERDLRNSVSLVDHPFVGKKDELKFPSLLPEASKEGKKVTQLYLVRYSLREGRLIRSQEKMSSKLTHEEVKEKILVKELKSLEFHYPYQDEESNEVSQSFWLDEPYFGIPRSVKLKILTPQITLEKIVSIPQGRMGRLVGER